MASLLSHDQLLSLIDANDGKTDLQRLPLMEDFLDLSRFNASTSLQPSTKLSTQPDTCSNSTSFAGDSNRDQYATQSLDCNSNIKNHPQLNTLSMNDNSNNVHQSTNLTTTSSQSITISPSQRQEMALATSDKMMKFLTTRAQKFAGFQANQAEHYSHLSPLMDLHVNNIGDPFSDVGGFRLNTKAAERAILKHWSELWVGPKENGSALAQPCSSHHLPYTPDSMDNSFFHSASGYVCSFGSTEGNLWSLRQARDYLKGKFLFSKLYGENLDKEQNFGPLSRNQLEDPITFFFKREEPYHPTAALIPTKQSSDGIFSPLPFSPDPTSTIFPTSPNQSTIPSLQMAPAPSSLSLLPGGDTDSPSPALTPLIPPGFKYNNNVFREPIILYPNSSHYSIGKIKDILEVHTPATFIKAFYTDYRRPTHILKPSQCFDYLQTLRLEAKAKIDGDNNNSNLLSIQENNSNPFPHHNLNLEVITTPVSRNYDPYDDLDEDLTAKNYIKVFGNDEWPQQLPTYEDGTMNLTALKFLTRFFFSLGNPIIISLNYGTTFTGAHDNPSYIEDVIKSTPGCHIESEEEVIVEGNLYTKIQRRNYYVHCDGALGAAYGAYWEQHSKKHMESLLETLLQQHSEDPIVQRYLYRIAQSGEILQKHKEKLLDQNTSSFNKNNCNKKDNCSLTMVTQSDSTVVSNDIIPFVNVSDAIKHQQIDYKAIILPTFTFRNSCVMSISMSGHKYIGAPSPSGVAMTLRKYMLDFLSAGVTYISSPDTTISGSRSGLNVYVLYDYLSRRGPELEILKYWTCYNTARFAAKHIAMSLKSTVLTIARDKPSKYWISSFDNILLEEQQSQYTKLNTTQSKFPPLVSNFPGSLSIIFPQPSFGVQDKYSLSCDVVHLPRKFGYNFDPTYLKDSPILSYNPLTETYILRAAHIFAMDSLSLELVQELSDDLANDQQLKDLIDAIIVTE